MFVSSRRRHTRCAVVTGVQTCALPNSISLEDMINQGVRQAYMHPENRLRASIVADPAFGRKNTKDNTPAVIHTRLVPGNTVDITVAAKGGGSENKTKFAMLNPSDSIVDRSEEHTSELQSLMRNSYAVFCL